MCPVAHAGAAKKYMYQDHDTDVVNEVPPTLNQWYTVFDAEDVRLLWCCITQSNDEAAIKAIEVKWTIDGNDYFVSVNLASADYRFIYRDHVPSTGGTLGLQHTNDTINAAYHVDKRGQSFKVDVRIVTALGTNQTLVCHCVRETLEET